MDYRETIIIMITGYLGGECGLLGNSAGLSQKFSMTLHHCWSPWLPAGCLPGCTVQSEQSSNSLNREPVVVGQE